MLLTLNQRSYRHIVRTLLLGEQPSLVRHSPWTTTHNACVEHESKVPQPLRGSLDEPRCSVCSRLLRRCCTANSGSRL